MSRNPGTSSVPTGDWIELKNPTGAGINIGGWYLSDNAITLMKYRIADNTWIQANGYAVFYEGTNFANVSDPGCLQAFALSELGEAVYLTSSPAAGVLGGYREDETFDASDKGYGNGDVQGVALVRYIKSTGGKDFVFATARTPGAANTAPLVGPMVINEIMYNPANSASSRDEYIELYNITNQAVLLYDPLNPANTWKFTDGIDFAFPTGATLAAHAYALVVGIDPALFRSRHPDVPLSTTIYGPYTGVLSDAGETVELSRPGEPEPAPSTVVPYYRVDRVTYGISGPWSTRADGRGSSLERLLATNYGNDSANWAASTNFGTPGRANVFLDTTAPSAPTGISVAAIGEQVVVTCAPSTDAQSGVAYYKIYRSLSFWFGTALVNVAASATPSIAEFGVAPGTNYTGYTVSAVNYDGIESAQVAVPGTAHVAALVSNSELDSTTVKVTFSENVQRDSAQDLANYTVTYGGGQVAVSEAALLADLRTVRLTLASPMTVGAAYTVTANNVLTQSGYTEIGAWETFTYATPVPAVWREYWTGISGSTVATLTANANYPASPSGVEIVSNLFENTSNWIDSYGDRMRAYITAPMTGTYYFWIASDDDSELWLNKTGNDPNGTLNKIASVSGSVLPRQWEKTTSNSQKSAAITLTAGQQYYIEALHKDNTGNDNLAIGWQLPDGTVERPIPASRLTPYYAAPAVTLNVTATDADASETGANKGTLQFTRSGGDTTKALTVYYTVTGSAKTVDYSQTLTGTLTFAANVLTVTQDVTPVDDSLFEGTETVVVSLISDPRFTFGTSSATISIADNDLPAVSVTATQPNAAEEGRATGTWTLTRA
ncbi:MAG: lamin tail domain-containing protein, partial [Planctomycetota bacterium]|nr:lamin tail domain-containing protein [Planctomycetota bacterium]